MIQIALFHQLNRNIVKFSLFPFVDKKLFFFKHFKLRIVFMVVTPVLEELLLVGKVFTHQMVFVLLRVVPT
jgi:hypothetical protein